MKAQPLGEPAASARGDADILLVEDNAMDAELTLAALGECGFANRVEHVEDGTEALDYIACTGEFIHRNPHAMPKFILLDLTLGKMSGLQVLRTLKSDERTRSVPIIVLTSSQMAIELVESYKLGVNSYVIKPTDATKFAEVVGAVGRYWLTLNALPPS
jgi:two-component system, response regulator